MRGFQTKDIFKMSKILKKMNLKEDIKKSVGNKVESKEGLVKKQEELGVELGMLIIENLHMAQTEVNELLADLVGVTAKQFNDLPIQDTIKILSLFQEQEGIVDFFKSAGKLMK